MGDLYCLDAASGQALWNINVLDFFGAKNIEWGLAESIQVDGPHVLSTPGGPQTAVVALDKMTGETVWESPSAEGDPAGYSTPTLVEYEGKRLIFAFMGKSLICADADSGGLYWRFPHETSYDVNAMKPIFHEGKVFISSGYGSGSRLLQVKHCHGGAWEMR
jgi:outer membrane protein assembly factor BamB